MWVLRQSTLIDVTQIDTSTELVGFRSTLGLAAGGKAGVATVLEIFRAEIERDMALMGKTRLSDISQADVNHLADFQADFQIRRNKIR